MNKTDQLSFFGFEADQGGVRPLAGHVKVAKPVVAPPVTKPSLTPALHMDEPPLQQEQEGLQHPHPISQNETFGRHDLANPVH